jgi:hypothetical protein
MGHLVRMDVLSPGQSARKEEGNIMANKRVFGLGGLSRALLTGAM